MSHRDCFFAVSSLVHKSQLLVLGEWIGAMVQVDSLDEVVVAVMKVTVAGGTGLTSGRGLRLFFG